MSGFNGFGPAQGSGGGGGGASFDGDLAGDVLTDTTGPLTLKPDTGETLVLQDEGGDPALTVNTDGTVSVPTGGQFIQVDSGGNNGIETLGDSSAPSIRLRNNAFISWSSSADAGGASVLELSRATTGVLRIDNGSNGAADAEVRLYNAAESAYVGYTSLTSTPDSTTPTLASLPTGGTAAQVGWVQINVNGTTSYVPYWQ